MEGLGLDGKCNATATPGLRALVEQLVDDKALPSNEITGFRGQAARANYLAADRIDLQLAAKEVCRYMRADGDVRGRHEAPWALPAGTQALSLDIPVLARRGRRRVLRHGLVGMSEDQKVDERRMHHDWQSLHQNLEFDTAVSDPVLW